MVPAIELLGCEQTLELDRAAVVDPLIVAVFHSLAAETFVFLFVARVPLLQLTLLLGRNIQRSAYGVVIDHPAGAGCGLGFRILNCKCRNGDRYDHQIPGSCHGSNVLHSRSVIATLIGILLVRKRCGGAGACLPFHAGGVGTTGIR